ncbi:MAG: hypothetical protein ACOC2O_02500 [Bacillota bacterium]
MQILAIDPGSEKSGIAIIDRQTKEIIKKDIVKTETINSYLSKVENNYKIEKIILGNGTACKKVKKHLQSSLNPEIIEEGNSTFEAEKLYRKENYSLLKRIMFKIISWKPARPVDDYSAVILAYRFLEQQKYDKGNK